MKTRWLLLICMPCIIVLSVELSAENFLVNKKKPQNQSMNKLKENYADELADLVRIIPGLQKQLADLQERLINELYSLLENDTKLGKVELDSYTCKAQELRCFLEQEYEHSLPVKSSFIRPTNKASCTSKVPKEDNAK